jgi:hypothetical protein
LSICDLTILSVLSKANFTALAVQVLDPAQYRMIDLHGSGCERRTLGSGCPILAMTGTGSSQFNTWMRRTYQAALKIIEQVCKNNRGLSNTTIRSDAQKLCQGTAVDGMVSLSRLQHLS